MRALVPPALQLPGETAWHRAYVNKYFPLKLTARRMLAPSVAHLSFRRDDGLPLDYLPGQFIQVHFHYADGSPARRSYSLATLHDHAMGPGEAVEIAVSYVPGGPRPRCSKACPRAARSTPAARTAVSACCRPTPTAATC